METRKPHLRIGILVAVHIVCGAILAMTTALSRGYNWPEVMKVAYAGFVGSQMMLVGTWIGLSNASWWSRIIFTVLGITWLSIVSMASRFPNYSVEVLFVLLIVTNCILGVAGTQGLARIFFARIAWSHSWDSFPKRGDVQFSLISLISLTTLSALFIGGAQLVREFGNQVGITGVVVISGIQTAHAALVMFIVVWASLGHGRLTVRVPIALAVISLLALVPPLIIESRWSSDVWEWLVVTAVAATITFTSLLVVRSCGYRLVSVRRKEEQPCPSE